MLPWLLLATLAASSPQTAPDPVASLEAAERAFARTAAERDVEAFRSFLLPESVFFGPGQPTLVGPDLIVEGWSIFFREDGPSIAWEPDSVVVLGDGSLGMTRGPWTTRGRGEEGIEVVRTGTFFSVWKWTEDGWRLLFDSGTQDPPPTATSE